MSSNSKREGIDIGDANDPATYLEMIKEWRSALEQAAKSTLAMTELPPEESENLYRALNLLPNIDHLIDAISRNISEPHLQAYTLSKVWGAISAVFIIANRGHENPITTKFLEDARRAQTRSANDAKKSRASYRDEIAVRHAAELQRSKPAHSKSKANRLAELIIDSVNADLIENKYEPEKNTDGIRKAIKRHMQARSEMA